MTSNESGQDAAPLETVLADLRVDPEAGLDGAEAALRLERFGPNAVEEHRVSPLRRMLAFFWGPIPWMIEIAAVLSALVGHWADFSIIVAMLVVNAGVGFFEEFKADNAIAALKRTLALRARVLRDGTWRMVEARALVPGDVVEVRIGNIVPADLRLVGGAYLSVDQSALTGESLPVDKAAGDVAYSSSVVKAGEMRAVVTATGTETFFGKTAKLVETAGAVSHFQRAVLRIGNFLIFSTLGLVSMILMVALFRHDPLVETVQFALILTVAAIPVALPAVLSVTMAVGAVRLARLRAIVSRLVSIEEMAGMDVLCSDKTGTLTKNELAAGEPVVIAAADRDELTLAAALASNRGGAKDAIDEAVSQAHGDPAVLDRFEVLTFTPFDPVAKRAEAEVRGPERTFRVTKGAPQVVLALTDPDPEERVRVETEIDRLAERGYRTLGVGRFDGDAGWRFLGLLPLFDPPRDDSAATIADARAKGLSVRMVTGDHVAIARETARELGLADEIVSAREVFGSDGTAHDGERIEAADGFAEVFPEHKFRIVRELQAHDHIVGMTGDGVNDAPALKQADIGIAVSGATDAARAAADLVLTAPGLSVITVAVAEARKIFERMVSYATFRIAETIRVLLFMTLSILIFNFYPVTAVMIVLLALLNDVPIMMIAYDNAPVAENPVRWDMERVLTLSVVLGVLGVIFTFVLFWFVQRYLGLGPELIRTVIFLKLLVSGHMTLFLARNAGWPWERPWPSWRLVAATEGTQVLGTLAAVYGWGVTPIGWGLALAIWGYAIVEALIENLGKVVAWRALGHRTSSHRRFLGRLHESAAPCPGRNC